MKNLRRIFLTATGSIALSIFFGSSSAFAAQINIAVNSSAIKQDQTLQVNVSLDTQGASANTVQAEITFPAGMFQLEKIIDGSSAVSLWIDPPHGSAPGVIDLAGIMPGGFTGSNAPLFSFTLQPLGVGAGTIQVASATVLANDGNGSSLPVSSGLATVNVSASIATSTQTVLSPPSIDYTAPNPFTPQIVSDPNIFGGKYFLVFSTTDNNSGIDHYEVLEVPNGASEQPFSLWHVATSPYLLTDQSLSSDIYVRAVDHDGNFIVVKVPAEHSYAPWNYAGIILIIFALALVLSLLIWRFRRRGHL